VLTDSHEHREIRRPMPGKPRAPLVESECRLRAHQRRRLDLPVENRKHRRELASVAARMTLPVG
jgi:hypothetical protein